MLRRDSREEREEIDRYIADYGTPGDVLPPSNADGVGRAPLGPARGWRRRQRKAESCDLCEGDLWVELPDGRITPCRCRAERKAKATRRQLRREGWLKGPSLSFSRPPLSQLPAEATHAVEELCHGVRDVSSDSPQAGLWLVGRAGSGKSSVCQFLAEQLGTRAVVRSSGEMLADLRLSAARDGEVSAEEEAERLTAAPLLVIDDLDRPALTRTPSSPFTMRESASSYDLLRLSRILRDRGAAQIPTVVTSSCSPAACTERTLSIKSDDLVRALLSIATGGADPIEDFPNYTETNLRGALADLRGETRIVTLDRAGSVRVAA